MKSTFRTSMLAMVLMVITLAPGYSNQAVAAEQTVISEWTDNTADHYAVAAEQTAPEVLYAQAGGDVSLDSLVDKGIDHWNNKPEKGEGVEAWVYWLFGIGTIVGAAVGWYSRKFLRK